MSIFQYINVKIQGILSILRIASQQTSAIDMIRNENPTCVIKNCTLDQVSLGKYVTILDGVYLSKVTIEDYSYVSNGSAIINTNIGRFCSIGPNIQIGLGPHPTRLFVSTYPAFYSKKNTGCGYPLRDDSIFDDSIPKTTIGHDVWIGLNVIIPGGVSIGTGAIIAAGSVVVKEVPPYAIVGGNPAKLIRYRFTEEEIDSLLKSEWWHWPIDEIKRNVNEFSNIGKFLKLIRKSGS